jgi:hypothetical protein
MFRHRGAVDSPLLLGYGMFVYFIGQGVDFSRRNRTILTILIQLIILMIFVLSNAYEGVITSFMIQPMQENRLKTVDDLVASDYEILADEVFNFIIKDDQRLNSLKSRLTIRKKLDSNIFLKEISTKRYVFIKKCDIAEYEITMLAATGHECCYLLPDKITTSYVKLESSYLNAFLERMQYYMDFCFQAGLQHIWKIVANQDFYKRLKVIHSDEIEYLKLKDLGQVFLVLGIGCGLSSFAFLIEIAFHDCLRNLKLRYLGHKLKNRVHQMAYKSIPKDPRYRRGALYYIIHRHQKLKRLKPKRLKVRQIFGQPRNLDD